MLNMFRKEKGVGSHLPERPFGCFAQMTPDPFFLSKREHVSDQILDFLWCEVLQVPVQVLWVVLG